MPVVHGADRIPSIISTVAPAIHSTPSSSSTSTSPHSASSASSPPRCLRSLLLEILLHHRRFLRIFLALRGGLSEALRDALPPTGTSGGLFLTRVGAGPARWPIPHPSRCGAALSASPSLNNNLLSDREIERERESGCIVVSEQAELRRRSFGVRDLACAFQGGAELRAAISRVEHARGRTRARVIAAVSPMCNTVCIACVFFLNQNPLRIATVAMNTVSPRCQERRDILVTARAGRGHEQLPYAYE